ncbi:insulinase family protein [Patescibacteria group bacterium]|nr:insulinase family protein [Patescibacteria group bacterium]MBU4601398.1 insulinase family protein [Patescibacteria group bacterium]MCG2698756.1 insulinase family protein [Candidatus Parcubacteria bacterium]
MYNLKTLNNKLRLITIPMRGTKTASVLVMVKTGSKYENKKNSGISHFLEHMFFKGTLKRPDTLAISSELDGIGAEFNAFTGKEYTGYYVKAEAGKIGLAMDVVSDMLLNSKFDAGEIEREKGVIIEELNMYRDNPMMYIEDLFEELLYGNQPASWDTIGTRENILRFKREDFIDYFDSQYGAQNTFVCVAGNIGAGTRHCAFLRGMTDKYFSKLKPSKFREKKPVEEKQTKPRIKLHYKKTDQAHLSVGARAFPLGHKDEFALKLLSAILGESMSSRLFIELRERKGLAYSIRTQAEFYTDSGYLTAQAGVPKDKLRQAIGIILAEYKKIAEHLADDKELERAKNLIKGRLAIQMESSSNVANWHGRQAVLRDEILTPEDFMKKINKVSARDISRAARNIFANKGLNLAVIGPFRDGDKFEKILRI